MRRPISGSLFFALILRIAAGPAIPSFAADPEPDERIVVTSTRLDDVETPRTDVPAHVTVIDRDRIASSGAMNIQDLLAEEAGVVLYDQVGNDVQKTLDLRGFTGGNGVAVFVDGARINDPRNNLAPLEQVPLNSIERIEVTRGPSAALAGGGSEAGVIRIVTRQGAERAATISLSGGTWNSLQATAAYGDHFGKFDLFVSGDYDTTDGFKTNADGDQTRFNVNGGWDLGGERRLGLMLLSSDLDYGAPGALTLAEFDADPNQNVYNVLDYSDVTNRQASLSFKGPIGGGFGLSATLAYRTDQAQTLSTGRAAPVFGGFFLDSDGATWSGVVQATRDFKTSTGSHLLAFGFEALDGSTDSLGYFTSPTGAYDPAFPGSKNTAGATNAGLFVQDNWTISGRWIVTAGARGDRSRADYEETIPGGPNGPIDGSATFSEISFHAGGTFRASERFAVYASYGNAFLPPSPEQLYAFPGFGANPELKPQDSRAYELGVHTSGTWNLDAALFWIDTQDEIIFDPTPVLPDDPFGRNANAGKTRRSGAEVSARGRLGRHVAAFANATYTNAEFTGGADDGNTVPLVPEWRLGAGLDATLPFGFGARADALWVDSQVLDNDAANAQAELAAYTVVNARVSWTRGLGPDASSKRGRMELFVEARNLLDETYATRGIYAFDFSAGTNAEFVTPAPGRRYLAGVRWRL
jgi:iron complex outermembrane receptor protein